MNTEGEMNMKTMTPRETRSHKANNNATMVKDSKPGLKVKTHVRSGLGGQTGEI